MPNNISIARPIVFVVDDDISVRESLELLIAEAGWRATMFASAEEFLAYPRERVASCLVLDVGLPDLNGLELQQRVAGRPGLPIIFITGRGDIPMYCAASSSASSCASVSARLLRCTAASAATSTAVRRARSTRGRSRSISPSAPTR